MKTQGNFSRSVAVVGIVTVLILMVPLVAMQFTDEVKWDFPDFVIMGGLIFCTGFTFVWITRHAPNMAYRVATGLSILSGFLMIWANLAVGLIGSGPNPGNLMYMGVVLAGIIGSFRSGFRPEGMAKAMYVVSLSLAAHTIIALLSGMQHYPGSSVQEIIAVNGFFIVLFTVAGLSYQYAARITSPAV